MWIKKTIVRFPYGNRTRRYLYNGQGAARTDRIAHCPNSLLLELPLPVAHCPNSLLLELLFEGECPPSPAPFHSNCSARPVSGHRRAVRALPVLLTNRSVAKD